MTAQSDDYLLYKGDWSKTKQRFLAFWEHEIIDRVCIAVTAPREEQVPLPEPVNNRQFPDSFQANTDPEYVVRLYNAEMANTYFGGDALPLALAPGCLQFGMYGGKSTIKGGTVWPDPDILDYRDWEDYRFDPERELVQQILAIVRALADDAPGKYLVTGAGFLGPLDAMSLMRGMGDFVAELALPECEPYIRKGQAEVMRGFRYMTEHCRSALNTDRAECLLFHGLWAPDWINHWSGDFSCMLGPRQFREWMIPEIEEMSKMYDYNFYHLDGPNAAVHLPMILEVRELKGIQYCPIFLTGTTTRDGLPVYKEIQRGGKLQWIECEYDEVEWLLTELDPRGVYLITTAPSTDAADELVRNAGKWSARAHRARA